MRGGVVSLPRFCEGLGMRSHGLLSEILVAGGGIEEWRAWGDGGGMSTKRFSLGS